MILDPQPIGNSAGIGTDVGFEGSNAADQVLSCGMAVMVRAAASPRTRHRCEPGCVPTCAACNDNVPRSDPSSNHQASATPPDYVLCIWPPGYSRSQVS